MSENFENGRTYYTRDGRKVVYIAPTKDERHVVAQVVEIQTYDGFEEADGPVTIERELFVKAPRDIVDEELRKAEDRLREIESLCFARTTSALSAEREVRQRLDALKKYRGLERIEDFIEGRVTHVVCPNEYGGGYEVKPIVDFEQREYGRPHGLKLISLFGDSKGDLTFRVNQYKDGSGGGWQEIILCSSQAEAEQKRRDRIASDLSAQSDHFDPARPHYFMACVRAALEHGVLVTEADMARYRECEAADIAKKRAAISKEIADREQRLNELQPFFPAEAERQPADKRRV